MADNQQNQSLAATTNTFSKGMLKDYYDTFVGEGLYTHARNAVNNSHDGQMGVIGNEPSNLFCIKLPYTLIGCIHLTDDQWAVFTTDDGDNSEIGIFDESECTYTKVVNSKCLNFKKSNLITGAFSKRYDCERIIYWDDGLNPTRSMDIDNPQQYYKYVDVYTDTCRVRNYLNELDCETLRLAPLIKHPCISIQKGVLPGTMPNGSYQACIAYTVNQVKVTDYIGLTPVQGLWSHENTSSSLMIYVSDVDINFSEFELVILANINSQTTAKRIGYYSTSQGAIYIDRWNQEYPVVAVPDVVFRSEAIEKTDAMYTTNNYLLRVGTYSKFKFNYQPLANQIKAKWVSVEYPADYYIKGGNKVGYMRDEVYSFFIRWVYNTGEFSESYHIPGRKPIATDIDPVTAGDDAYEVLEGIPRQFWQVQNTGSIGSLPLVLNPSYLNGGVIIGTGDMAYWESTEKYPDNNISVWGTLCGKPIRHHKFPDETISFNSNNPVSIFGNSGRTINILGVQFENIQPPVDINGNLIPEIVGYEILRGSREGNKSIIAKGLLNNMRTFNLGRNDGVTGLFQNYPYNDLRDDDPYLSSQAQGYKKDIFSFHGPDVSFSNPFLNEGELKLYQNFSGSSQGYFENSWKHPRFKLASNLIKIISVIVAAMGAAEAVQGFGALGGGSSAIRVDFAGTENSPIAFGYQIPPFPSAPSAAGGDFTGTASALLAWGYYVASVAGWAATVGAIVALAVKMAEAKAQKVFDLLMYLAPRVQFASQYNSHGFYNQYAFIPLNNRRRKVLESVYGGNNLLQFTSKYEIQNIQRSKAVFIKVNRDINDPTIQDTSRFLKSSGYTGGTISSYYGALKIPVASQYGQLESIKQLPVSTCITLKNITSTNVLFGGDVYINRFTEKNTMPFFTTWLMGEPDEFEFNYKLYYNIPSPNYWINNFAYKVEFFGNLLSNYRNLDGKSEGFFGVNGGDFYLFNSGVRDFFVESEVNVAYRDWEEDIPHRHYDDKRFTDLSLMFRSDIATSGNYYKYDYSLSISKLFSSHISWGELLPRDYNTVTAATCYVYRPNRVIYSLPQQSGSKKDSWRSFLTNNYKDFPSRVSSIKPINKTGSLFMMANQSPMSFMGVEELKVDGTGAKITIGDGGLFQQAMQSVTNVDESFEYASNQGKYCSINTVHGVFWVSQNQGKIFLYAGQLKEISAAAGMRWWFAKYLPSQLLKAYPNYPLYDNPVKGVGVQMMYDNTYDILYITKKDYIPKTSSLKLKGNEFTFNDIPIPLTDTNYFEPASWTISYDCKSEAWISFHDWIPSFLIPGRSHFMSVNIDSIYKHNVRCDSYCNFYGVDYPFEIEFVSATGQTVNSMRSIEYLLEVYNYHNDCRDKFHVLDENFDQAIIYNSEQISGILQLNLKPKNNPVAALGYPIIRNSPNYIDILFSKEENKYRFDQFWDITKNRGEYNPISIPMFNVEPNGYIYPINPNYVNYNKSVLERKKFRHNVNKVFLRKVRSKNNKFLFKISNQKLLQSPR